MINRKEFTKMAKRIVQSNSGIKNPRLMHPLREWWIGLLVATLLFSAISVWSTQIYAGYQSIANAEGSFDEVAPVVYRESLVDTVLAEFSHRDERHNSYLPKKEGSATSDIEAAVTIVSEPADTLGINEDEPTSATEQIFLQEDQNGAPRREVVPQNN
jgi:hypothetical protein